MTSSDQPDDRQAENPCGAPRTDAHPPALIAPSAGRFGWRGYRLGAFVGSSFIVGSLVSIAILCGSRSPGVAGDDRPIRRSPPETRDELRQQLRKSPLAYPERVTIPDDLASTRIRADKDGRNPWLSFPIAEYSVAHFEGWQECLRQVVAGNPEYDQELGPPTYSTDAFDEWKGRHDGYDACRAKVKELLKIHGVAAVRRAAETAIYPAGQHIARGGIERRPLPYKRATK